MSKKRLDPFGHIAFGKDGRVTPHISHFSTNNEEREKNRGEAFARWLAKDRNVAVTFKKTKGQSDQDGELTVAEQQIVVEITEIQRLEFARATGHAGPGGWSILSEGRLLEVDQAAFDNIFIKKIKAKKDKHYPKPKGKKFWLLIYTPFDEVMPDLYGHSAWQVAREYCAREGILPFDEVWFIPTEMQPSRLWPAA